LFSSPIHPKAPQDDRDRQGEGRRPVHPLGELHVADVGRVHAKDAGHGAEREEDDGDERERVDGLLLPVLDQVDLVDALKWPESARSETRK
jgi:hypothetical protein